MAADLGKMPIGWAAVGMWWKAGDVAHYWNGSKMECGTEHRGHFWWPRSTVGDDAMTARSDAAVRCEYCVAAMSGTEVSTDGPWLERLGPARCAGVVELVTGKRVGADPTAEMAALVAADIDPLYLLGRRRAGSSGEWRPGWPAPRSITDLDSDDERYPAALSELLDALSGRAARAMLRAVLDEGHVELLNRRHQPLGVVDAAGWVNAKALTHIGRPALALDADGRVVLARDVPPDIIEAGKAVARQTDTRVRGKMPPTRSRAVRKVVPRVTPRPADPAPLVQTPAPSATTPASESSSEVAPAVAAMSAPCATAEGRDPDDHRTIDLVERAAARATPLGRKVVDGLDALPAGRTAATVLDDGRVVFQRRPGVAIVVDRRGRGAVGWLDDAEGEGVSLDALAVAVVGRLEQRAVEGFEQPDLLTELAPVRAVGLLRGGRVLDRQTGMGHQPGRRLPGLIWDIERPIGEPASPAWRSTVSYDSTRIEAHRSHDGSGWHLTWVTGCGYWCWGVPAVPLAVALLRIRAYLFGVAGAGSPPPISEDALREELRGHAFTMAGRGRMALWNLWRSASVEPFMRRAGLPAPGEETAARPAPPQRTRSRAARVDAALRRRGMHLERNPLPGVPELRIAASVRWTVRRLCDDHPMSPSKADPVAAATFALAVDGGDVGEAEAPAIALQPPWVMAWNGALTHDAMPGPRGAFGSIPMAQQIGAWLDAITMQFPLLRKLGAPGCSTGWASWGRFVPDVLGGYVQIVYDPPTAHGNLGPAQLKPPEGVVGPYVRLGDEVVEVPEPCPHLLAVAAARLAALALGGVDQRGRQSGMGRNRRATGAQPEEPRAEPVRQPDDGQTVASPEPEPSHGAATCEPEAGQSVDLVQVDAPRSPAEGRRVLVELDLQPRRASGRGEEAAPAAERHVGAPSDAAARVLAHWQGLAPKTGRKPKVPPEALLVIRARLIADGADDHDGAVAEAASVRYGKCVSRLAVQRAHATASERLEAIAAELGADVVTEAVDALGWAPRWEASA